MLQERLPSAYEKKRNNKCVDKCKDKRTSIKAKKQERLDTQLLFILM